MFFCIYIFEGIHNTYYDNLSSINNISLGGGRGGVSRNLIFTNMGAGVQNGHFGTNVINAQPVIVSILTMIQI